MSNNTQFRKQEIIDKAVKDSIDNFVRSITKTNVASPRIDDEIPDVKEYIKTYTNIDSFNNDLSEINEGLIKTYPIDKVVNYMLRKYALKDKQVQVQTINNGIVPIDIICVILRSNIDANTLGDIKHDLRTCGYFLCQSPNQIKGTDYFVYPFEPKFSKDITSLVKQNYKYLFHSSAKIYYESIIKKGFVPKSKNLLFFYPDRTFLMVGNNLTSKQIGALKNVQNKRSEQADPNNPNENKEYLLYTIDVSKLPNNVQFYCDPMAPSAIFTYDNIPPSVIINIEPFTL